MLIIVGATGGIGSGLVEHFRDRPSSTHEWGEVLATTRDELDLEDPSTVERFFAEAVDQAEPNEPLMIVNAAGVSLNGYLHKQTLEDWRTTLVVDLEAAFLLVRAAHPYLRQRPRSAIVLLSSVVAEIGVPGTAAYSTAKAGLRGFVRTAGRELSRIGTRINCIELGYFDRGMISQIPAAEIERLLNEIPLGRLGTIADLAAAVEFVLRCEYLTGGVIKLNGGLT